MFTVHLAHEIRPACVNSPSINVIQMNVKFIRLFTWASLARRIVAVLPDTKIIKYHAVTQRLSFAVYINIV